MMSFARYSIDAFTYKKAFSILGVPPSVSLCLFIFCILPCLVCHLYKATDRRPIEGESDSAQGLTLLHIVLHCIEVHPVNCICGLNVLNIDT